MNNIPDYGDEPVSRWACQEAIRVLSAKYDWGIPLDDLVEPVLHVARLETPPIAWEPLIKTQYQLALYAACRQTAAPDRRQRAFGDLHRYLYRTASNCWPDLAEEVAQQALILVYEKLDTCRHPAAFLTFAMWQMRRAFTNIKRKSEPAVSIETITELELDLALPLAAESLFDQDCLRLVLEAISRMPEQQRQVILLKYLEHLSDTTISARTNLSISNVRVQRNRGLKRLRNDRQLRERCVDTQIGV